MLMPSILSVTCTNTSNEMKFTDYGYEIFSQGKPEGPKQKTKPTRKNSEIMTIRKEILGFDFFYKNTLSEIHMLWHIFFQGKT